MTRPAWFGTTLCWVLTVFLLGAAAGAVIEFIQLAAGTRPVSADPVTFRPPARGWDLVLAVAGLLGRLVLFGWFLFLLWSTRPRISGPLAA